MILTDEAIAFLESSVSITLASCSGACVPSVARAKGCRVLPGTRPRLRMLVSQAECRELLDDVRATQALAVTVGHVMSHRTLQFKGCDAQIDLALPEDTAAAAAYVRGFGDVILEIGFARVFTHAFLSADVDDLQVIVFTPVDVYQQTPGPDAGAKLLQP